MSDPWVTRLNLVSCHVLTVVKNLKTCLKQAPAEGQAPNSWKTQLRARNRRKLFVAGTSRLTTRTLSASHRLSASPRFTPCSASDGSLCSILALVL